MVNKLLYGVLLLALLTNAGSISEAKDGRLDPGPITWWKDSWCQAPIVASRANSGESVTLTFRYRPTTTITGAVYVKPPSDINGGIASPISTDDTVTGGRDTTGWLTVTSWPNKSEAYGPFKLYSMESDEDKSQIIDLSTNFGTIFITPAVSGGSGLTVTSTSTSPLPVRSSVSLNFEFSVDIDLWPNDVVVIPVPTDWNIGTSPICESVEAGETTNPFKSATDTHILPCVVDTVTDESTDPDTVTKTILVYGMSKDIDVSEYNGSIDFMLKVGTFTTPGWLKTSTTWNVEIWRSKTMNIIKKYGSSSSPDLIAGALTISDWKSHNGLDSSYMTADVPVYMDVTVTTTNPIPDGGKIVIAFNSTQSECYVNDANITCTLDNSDKTVVLTFAEGIAAGSVTFSTLNRFDIGASKPTISNSSYSAIDDGTKIDKLAANRDLTISGSEVVKASTFTYFTTSTDGTLTHDLDKVGEAFKYIGAKASFPAYSGTVTLSVAQLRVPFVASGSKLTNYTIPSGSTFKAAHIIGTSDITSISAQVNGVTQTALAQAASANDNKLTMTIPSGGISLTTETNVTIAFHNVDSSSNAEANLENPQVQKNLATMYEAWLIYGSTDKKYIMTEQLVFDNEPMHPATTAVGICGDVAKIVFQAPFEVTFETGTKTFYFDLTVPSITDSGIADNEVYPSYSSIASVGDFQKVSNTLLTSEVTAFSHTTTTDLFIALPDGPINVEFYYLDDGDKTGEKFKIVSSGSVLVDDQDGGDPNTFALGTSPLVVGSGSTLTTTTAAGIFNNAPGEISFQLPAGFRFTSNNITVGSTSETAHSITSSTNYYFAYPALVTDSVTPEANDTLAVAIDAYYVSTGAGANIAAGNAANCIYSDDNIVPTAGALSSVSGTPDTCTARGPDSYNETVKVNFTTANPLYEEGKIIVTLGSAWGFYDLTDCSSNVTATTHTCDKNNRTCTISGITATSGTSPVEVTFTNVLPPETTGDKTIWSSIVVQTKDDDVVDSFTGTSDNCNVTTANAKGNNTVNSSSTLIPNNRTYPKADLYLNFSLGKAAPLGSKIYITSPTGSWGITTDINEYVFFSKKYSSVEITASSQLTITTNEAINAGTELELYVEQAITSNDAATTGDFYIKTTYQSIILTEDSATTPGTGENLTLDVSIPGSITPSNPGLSLDVYTAAESAQYTFAFQSNQEFESGDKIWIQFGKDYCPLLGASYIRYKDEEPNTYYIDCKSEQLGDIECIVDHWYVYVVGGNSISANTEITITLYGVVNPAETTATSKFTILHMRGYVGQARAELEAVAIKSLPDNISVKKVTASNNNLFATGDYTFEMYLGTDLSTDHMLGIYLPRQYNLGLSRNNESISCSLAYVDQSDDSANPDEQSVSGVSSCTSEDGFVKMEIPTGGVSTGATTKLVYRVTSLSNPEWGLEREDAAQSWNFDAFDDVTYTVYDEWTNQFQVFMYDTTLDEYVAKSYFDINGAYLGFDRRERSFIVNGYDPILMTGRIVVRPGTQTKDLPITMRNSEILAAKKVVFTPSTNSASADSGKLRYTSHIDDFTFTNSKSSIKFRVASAIDLDQGIYYINWSLDETKQDSMTDNQYDPPAKTLVEVNTDQSKVAVSIEDIDPISIGTRTKYIKVHVDYAPHTELVITPSLANTDVTGITFSPTSLTFTYDVNDRYFAIQVASDYDLTTFTGPQSVNFAKSGTDASAYSEISAKTITISATTVTEPGNMTGCKVSDAKKVSGDLSISFDSDGEVYFQISSKGTFVLSYADLLVQVGDIFSIDDTPAGDTSTVDDDYEPNDADKSDPRVPAWVAFERRKSKKCMENSYYSGVIVDATNVVTYEITGLCAQMDYQSSCYGVNASQTASEVLTETWKTDNMDDPATVSVALAGDVPDSYSDGIINLLATAMGISPLRLLDVTRVTARRLQDSTVTSTTFSATVAQDRRIEGPSPTDLGRLDEENDEYFKTGIRDLITNYGDQSITVTPTTIGAGSIPTPAWVTGGSPSRVSETTNSVTASMQCNTTGELCGMCEKTSEIVSNKAVNHDQVLTGLNSNNDEAGGWNCMDYEDTSTSTNLVVSGLEHSTAYRCSYQCFNTFPVYPGYVAYSEDNPIASVSFTTQNVDEDDDEDSASYLQALLALLMVLAF